MTVLSINAIITVSAAIAGFMLGRKFEKIKREDINPNQIYITGCNKAKSDCKSAKIGQLYEHKSYNNDPFERLKHPVRVINIKEGYVRYKYEYGSIISSMKESLFCENYVEI